MNADLRPAPFPVRRDARAALPALALAALAVGLGGCAARGATLGDEIGAAGARYAAIGERWEDGQDKVKKGRLSLRWFHWAIVALSLATTVAGWQLALDATEAKAARRLVRSADPARPQGTARGRGRAPAPSWQRVRDRVEIPSRHL